MPLPPCLGLLGEEPNEQRSPLGDVGNAEYMFLPFLYSATYPYFGWEYRMFGMGPHCAESPWFGSALWVSRACSRREAFQAGQKWVWHLN